MVRRREQAIAEAVARASRSKRSGADRTVGDFADWWLTTCAPRLRFGSIGKYRERLVRLGPLADFALGDVTAEHVANWQTWLLTESRSTGRPLAPKTVADTRSTVRQMFASASAPTN